MQRVWVLHNPLAGRQGTASAVEAAAEALAARGVSVNLRRPPSVTELRQAAREAIAAPVDAVLVAGGDGSLGAVAAELAGSPVVLGFLPAGTANVWAREVGLPQPAWFRPHVLEQAALELLNGQIHLADLGRCNDQLFLLWAGLGLDAFVVDRLEPQRALWRPIGLPYNIAATFVIASQWRGADMRMVVDGREVAGHYLVAVVANVSWYAGGVFRLRSGISLDDGQMDVWLFEGRSYAETLAHAARLFVSRHARHPQVTGLRAARVDVYTADPQAFHTDGEPHPPTTHLSIEVVPAALRVLVPRTAPPHLFLKAQLRVAA